MITLPLAPSIVNPARAGNPRDAWPVWTDADTWELEPDADAIPDADEPRPTSGPDFEPDPEDDLEWLGYQLGLDREDAAPTDHLAPVAARRFSAGLAAGSLEWERRLDEMFAGVAADGRVTDLDVHPRGVC